MISHPSRETQYGMIALSQKGNTCIQVIFTQSSVSMTTTSEYLPVSGSMYLLCICPSLHDYIRSRFTKTNCNRPSNESHTWPACDLSNCASSRQKHENKLTIKFPVRFKSHKQISLPTQFRPSPMTQYMLHSNASTTATQTTNVTWCIWEIKTNIPKQEVSTYHFSLSVRCQPTISTPSSPCLQCPTLHIVLEGEDLQIKHAIAVRQTNWNSHRVQNIEIKSTATQRHLNITTEMENDKCSENNSSEVPTLTHPFSANGWWKSALVHLMGSTFVRLTISTFRFSPDSSEVWFQTSCKLNCPNCCKLPIHIDPCMLQWALSQRPQENIPAQQYTLTTPKPGWVRVGTSN